MYVCMNVVMYVCVYVVMYVCVYVCMHVCVHTCMRAVTFFVAPQLLCSLPLPRFRLACISVGQNLRLEATARNLSGLSQLSPAVVQAITSPIGTGLLPDDTFQPTVVVRAFTSHVSLISLPFVQHFLGPIFFAGMTVTGLHSSSLFFQFGHSCQDVQTELVFARVRD